MQERILILDDEAAIAGSLQRILEKEGYTVETAHDDHSFYDTYDKFQPHLIVLDIDLKNSEENGIDIFKNLLRRDDFQSRVLILSGKATNMQVTEAMKLGADNFFEKGQTFSNRKLITDIRQSMELCKRDSEIRELRMQNFDEVLIGESPAMLECKQRIIQLAQTDLPVLITGETGTGKGVAAELIHRHSKRAAGPYRELDISALSETIVESELFGHVKGAFTGADSSKRGYFEMADGGTLFLDEMANVSMTVQGKLLKAIEEQQVPVVGSGGSKRKVNVRIIAASNQNISELVNNGDFRRDLYFRMAIGNIEIPPLRKRGNDVILLMSRLLVSFLREYHTMLDIAIEDVKQPLLSYSWPGNVRELRYFCRTLCELNRRVDNQLLLQAFQQLTQCNRQLKPGSGSTDDLTQMQSHSQAMREFEIRYIQFHLQKNTGVKETADSIGMEKSTLYKKIKNLPVE